LKLTGHEGEIAALAFGPDGRTLSSFAQDGQGYIWSLMPKSPGGRRAPLAELWDTLKEAQAADVYRAQWQMIADPKQTAAFLRERLKPIPIADPVKAQKWITDLGSDTFAVRDAAFKQLLQAGETVQEPIQKALNEDLPLETSRRMKQVLERIANTPDAETTRTIHAIMVLERIGSPDAQNILEIMARGAPGTRVTNEAAAALHRVQRAGNAK